jgi:hypothetical protein
MSEKYIVVKSNGDKATGVVTEQSNVIRSTQSEIDNVISSGVLEVANILSGKDVEDPTRKRCSRCAKLGRMPFYPIEDFSLLANGKRLSQCKVCRTEQSVAWEARKKEHRRAYHKEYQKTRIPATRVPKALKLYAEAMREAESSVDAKEAMFVAIPNIEVENTDNKP